MPEPAMIEAIRTLCGNAALIRLMRGSHQSSGLSEMSSQFQDECSTPARPRFIDSADDSGLWRRNFVFGPATFTTGCIPIVFVTTPPQPASNAWSMFDSDSVGGADASMKGFSNRMPVNDTDRSMPICPPAPRGVCGEDNRLGGRRGRPPALGAGRWALGDGVAPTSVGRLLDAVRG